MSQVGGMGDVVTALSRAVKEAGHNVKVIVPKYDVINYAEVRNTLPTGSGMQPKVPEARSFIESLCLSTWMTMQELFSRMSTLQRTTCIILGYYLLIIVRCFAGLQHKAAGRLLVRRHTSEGLAWHRGGAGYRLPGALQRERVGGLHLRSQRRRRTFRLLLRRRVRVPEASFQRAAVRDLFPPLGGESQQILTPIEANRLWKVASSAAGRKLNLTLSLKYTLWSLPLEN